MSDQQPQAITLHESDNEAAPQPRGDNHAPLCDAQQSYVPIPNEQWRVIPCYSGFEASSLGRIRNRATGHMLAITGGNAYEYPRVTLHINGKSKTIECHRLVAAAFIGPTPPGHHINHKNTNKYDCRLENLEITTVQRNREHAMQHGQCGGKLKPRDVVAVRKLLAAAVDVATVATAFNVKPQAIQNIGAGRSWRAIPNEPVSRETKNLPLDFMEKIN